jgi:hypothetical protein
MEMYLRAHREKSRRAVQAALVERTAARREASSQQRRSEPADEKSATNAFILLSRRRVLRPPNRRDQPYFLSSLETKIALEKMRDSCSSCRTHIGKKHRPRIDPFSIHNAETLVVAVRRDWGEAQGNYDEFRFFKKPYNNAINALRRAFCARL